MEVTSGKGTTRCRKRYGICNWTNMELKSSLYPQAFKLLKLSEAEFGHH